MSKLYTQPSPHLLGLEHGDGGARLARAAGAACRVGVQGKVSAASSEGHMRTEAGGAGRPLGPAAPHMLFAKKTRAVCRA